MTRLNFGKFLREIRYKRDISIKKLAPLLGIRYPYLSQLENNLRTPSLKTILKLSRFFNVPVVEFTQRCKNLHNYSEFFLTDIEKNRLKIRSVPYVDSESIEKMTDKDLINKLKKVLGKKRFKEFIVKATKTSTAEERLEAIEKVKFRQIKNLRSTHFKQPCKKPIPRRNNQKRYTSTKTLTSSKNDGGENSEDGESDNNIDFK